MNANWNETEPPKASSRRQLFSRFVTVERVEYLVEVYCYGEQDTWWFRVERQPEEGGTVWRYLWDYSIEDTDGRDVVDALRSGLREPRRRMRNHLENWQAFRNYAADEPAGNVKGSKRSYYMRNSNESLKSALTYAPKWKLAKQLWKGLTKL